MNVVIYNKDFEAITVIELPIEVIAKMKKEPYFRWRVPVYRTVKFTPYDPDEDIQTPRYVDLHTERILRRCGTQEMVIMADDEESALLLASSCLPGQRTAFKEEFEKGFISAIFKVLGN